MQKLEGFDIDMIAPSHGVVYNNPKFILDAYNEWISDSVENKAMILFVSMHGSTRTMVDHLADALIKQNVTVHVFNLTNADTGEIAKELVDTATVIVATPQVLVGPHPTAVSATYLLNALRPKIKHLAIIGSYGWGGKMVEYLKSLITNIKPEILEPIVVKGLPNEKHLGEFDKLADEIAKKHKNLES
jgi:flavorubredoxin